MGTFQPDVPNQHNAAVFDRPGTLSVKLTTIETPKPQQGQILVRLTHSGVCHSDLAVMMNTWNILPFPTQPGQVGGHEGVGEVAGLGPGAEITGIKVGDRVGIKWIAETCGSCEGCFAGDDPLCDNYKISGYYTPGTFQQYVVSSATYVTPIPEGVPSEIAAPLLCGGVTVYSALKKTGARPGDCVVVAGCSGGLGHLALQIGSRALGFRMLGIDAGNKSQVAVDSGCERFFDIMQYGRDDAGASQLEEEVKKATPSGKGAKGVVVCTANSAAYAQAIRFLKPKGKVVCVGVPEGRVTPIEGADAGNFVAKQMSIEGSAVGNRIEALEVMAFAARGLIKPQITIEKLDNLADVLRRMHEGQVQGRVVLDLTG